MHDALHQTRTAFAQLFPGPEEGRLVEINPPPFFWLRVPDAKSYTIHLESQDGSIRTSREVSENYWLPSEVLKAGKYRWDLEVGGARRGWWNFELSSEASIQIIPTADDVLKNLPLGHPRHFLRRTDAAQTRKHHARHLPSLRQTIALALADGLPPTPDIHIPEDPKLQNLRYREWTNLARKHIDRNLVACALGHLLLSDPKATEMARRSLLTICTWNPEGPSGVDGAWGDEIGLSLVRCLPFVIDALADALTEKEIHFAKKALSNYARQAYERMRRTDFTHTPGISHVGRLGGYLGEAALILRGTINEDECRTWLDYALRVYATFFPFFGGTDGAWAEGTFYATSYTRWYLPFFLAVERLTAFSFLERPFYRRLSDFFLHFARVGWDAHPFGDGWWCHPDDVEWPGFFAQDPFRVYAERFGDAQLHAYRKNIPPPKHLELHLLDLFVPPALLKPFPKKNPVSRKTDALFPDTGFASLQVDLVNEKKNTALLVRASKFGNGSHQHADQGSFSLIHRSKGLVIPSGTFGAIYGSEHHDQWTRQTKAHNCVLIGGKGQRPGFVGSAKFQSLEEGEVGGNAFSHLVADLTQAYEDATLYLRHFYFFKPDLIAVVDDLRLKSAKKLTWCLHTPYRPRLEKKKTVMTTPGTRLEVALASGGKLHSPKIFDRYPIPVNRGIPKNFAVKRPELFHWNWEFPASKDHLVYTIFSVGRALIDGELSSASFQFKKNLAFVRARDAFKLESRR